MKPDAINYCRTRSMFLHQINEAQHRCNINGTIEIVQWLDENDQVIDQVEIAPDPSRKIVRNQWR